jgi:predicted RNA-binding Zn-ribbon protein involved in translation (DUF1610 family)
MPEFALLALLIGVFVPLTLCVWLGKELRSRIESNRRTLARHHCPSCGQVLGMSSALRAERDWKEHSKAIWEKNRGQRLRLTAVWPVTCACGWKGLFTPSENGLLENA